MENTDKILTERAEVILQEFFEQIEVGHIPTFETLMEMLDYLMNLVPIPTFEMVCVSSLTCTLYPEPFQRTVHRKIQKLLRSLRPIKGDTNHETGNHRSL